MAFKRSAVRSRLTPPFIFSVDFTAESSKTLIRRSQANLQISIKFRNCN